MRPAHRSWATRAAGALAADVLVPLGVAVAAGAVVAATVEPAWRAPGLPWVAGVAKNVEAAAVAAGLAAALGARLLLVSPGGRAAIASVAALATVGWIVLARVAAPRALASAWPQLLLVGLAVAALRGGAARAIAAGMPSAPRGACILAAAAVAVLAAAAFVIGLEPLVIDVFHHGEVLASAVDLLRGGLPFKTFVWPHGAHDSGLAAAWIVLTGKIGTTPVALGQATCRALGALAAYLLGTRLAGGRAAGLALAAALVLGPVLTVPRPLLHEPTFHLHQLGVTLPVVVALALLVRPAGPAAGAAGIAIGLGYVFRIEVGLYALVAAGTLLADDALGRPGPLPRRLIAGAAAGVRLLAGAALAIVICRLVLGWPGMPWLTLTFGDLRRYHRDAGGLPFPWPLRGATPGPPTAVATGWLVFVLLLAVQALRAPRATVEAAPRRRALVFLAVFAALATRSALERSDPGHVLQWAALPILGVAALAAGGVAARLGLAPGRGALLLAALILVLDVGGLRLAAPAPRAPGAALDLLGGGLALARAHLAPNPPAGACADRSFTPREAALAPNAAFIDAVCAFEEQRARLGLGEILIAHSAPWYWVRLGLTPPSRHFAFARAYTPAAQLELVEAIRALAPPALLRVHGFGAFPSFDVPDALRVPVVDAYLRARRGDARPIATPLGTLVLWNLPADAAPTPAAGADSEVGAAVDLVLRAPAAGLRFAQGWAADRAAGRPVATLEPATAGDPALVDYGLPRTDVAAHFANPALTTSGWDVLLPDAPGAAPAPTVLRAGVSGGGGRITVDWKAAPVLPPLTGPEWDALPPAVARAAALGRADRAAALAARR